MFATDLMVRPALLVLLLNETIFEKAISAGSLGVSAAGRSNLDRTTNFSS
jgi:hypothetical protein